MKFAAFGRTQNLYDSIRFLVKHGHQAVLIGTCQAAPEYTVTEADFEHLAKELGCPFFNDAAINRSQYINMARHSGAEIAISINWLTLIGQEMLDQFKYGVVNAHAGDLPRYRGNAAPNWAILSGENQIVISLHQMTTELDAGPILLQRSFSLTPRTYIGEVYQFLAANLPQMYLELLDGLTSGKIIPRPQPEETAQWLRGLPRLPRDSEIDWRLSAEYLDRLVRASAEPFGGAYSFIGLEKVIVWRAHVQPLPYPMLGTPGQVVSRDAVSGEVAVLTGDGLLILEEIETESGGRDRAARLIQSTRTRFGIDTSTAIEQLTKRVDELERAIARLNKKD